MSHIDNEVRATKAYHILVQATNVHLDLTEMIQRLANYGGKKTLVAAYKALTGETNKHADARKVISQFWYKLHIQEDSLEGKEILLNEFGNDIRLSDIEECRHECEAFGLNYDSPSLDLDAGYRS